MTGSSSSRDELRADAKDARYLERCSAILGRIFEGYGPPDFAVRLWDGSFAVEPAEGEPRFTLVINHPGALRRMFLPPSELNLGEAFIFSDFDIEGDVIAATGLAIYIREMKLPLKQQLWLAAQLLALPRHYTSETTRRGLRPGGVRHSRRRDREAVQFHYDVSNEFYQLWLDDWMIYSCAYFKTGDEDIHTAQRQKLEHICRKLQLRPGERLLDIGCGWGGLVIYAARYYGVEAMGVTLSENQFALARERASEAGVEDRVEVRLQDYREIPVDERFDKVASVGMVEHVGRAKLPVYFERAWRLLRPGGLFLNHGIASMTSHLAQVSLLRRLLYRDNSFINRYVFPDGELTDINQLLAAAEAAGFEVRDVESLREHYALTLRHWVQRLEAHKQEALRCVDEPTYRVWRLYMAASAQGFAASHTNVYQVLLSKNAEHGASRQPLTRDFMYQQPEGERRSTG